MKNKHIASFTRVALAAPSLVAILLATTLAQAAEKSPSEKIELLDPSLSQWEVFIGVPHTSITGLPAGTPQSEDVTKGTPLGLNNDPKKVFSTKTENGETILHSCCPGSPFSHRHPIGYHTRSSSRKIA